MGKSEIELKIKKLDWLLAKDMMAMLKALRADSYTPALLKGHNKFLKKTLREVDVLSKKLEKLKSK